MALHVATATDRINHGSTASLDNLTAWTAISVFRTPATMTGFRSMAYKSATSADYIKYMQTAGISGGLVKIGARVAYTTTVTFYATDFVLGPDEERFLAVTFDAAAAAGDFFRFYLGTVGGARAALLSVTTQTDPAGSRVGDGSGSVTVGDPLWTAGEDPHEMEYSLFALYGRRLNRDAIVEQQEQTDGPIDPASCVLFSHYGIIGGTGQQTDWSGKGNHGSVTGATVDRHAPITVFTRQPVILPLEVAAGIDNDRLARMGFAASGGGLLPWMWGLLVAWIGQWTW